MNIYIYGRLDGYIYIYIEHHLVSHHMPLKEHPDHHLQSPAEQLSNAHLVAVLVIPVVPGPGNEDSSKNIGKLVIETRSRDTLW